MTGDDSVAKPKGRADASALAAASLVVVFAAWAWLAMMFTHEVGHVTGAWITGGPVVSLELSPGALSHTLVRPNPRPAVVLWGGFVCGWLAPLATAPAWRVRAGRVGVLLRAWAAFCLLAGGSYLAVGGSERLTDTGQLRALGWPPSMLIAIGASVAVVGYLWSRAAWRELADDASRRPVAWRVVAAWSAWLVVWTATQEGVARLLEPGEQRPIISVMSVSGPEIGRKAALPVVAPVVPNVAASFPYPRACR